MIKNSKKKKSQRCITLPNNKIVALHNEFGLASLHKKSYQQKCVPEFWGCVMPQNFQQAQKHKLQKSQRSKTQQKQSQTKMKSWQTYQIKQLIGGQNLLTNYLRRKKKHSERQFQMKEQEIFEKKKNYKYNQGVINIIKLNEQDNGDPLQKYFFDIDIPNTTKNNQNQESQKMKSLKQIMKWKNKIAANIQTSLQHRKSMQKNVY